MLIDTSFIDLKNLHFSCSWILKKINLKLKSLNKKNYIESKNVVYLVNENSSLENFKFNKKFINSLNAC
tara:strand:+ start:6465 stop:6671 length:207 start_codon:yes stop_codon:yes gene_type:complete